MMYFHDSPQFLPASVAVMSPTDGIVSQLTLYSADAGSVYNSTQGSCVVCYKMEALSAIFPLERLVTLHTT
jgi:hypothetical protein